jgi:hypothetical protein
MAGSAGESLTTHLPVDWMRERRVKIGLPQRNPTLMFETTAEVMCPHCGETIVLFLDLSVDEQTYIEDCSVCCQPMTVSYSAADGELQGVQVDAAS